MSTATGRRAENNAAEYLSSHGFIVDDLNWRNRFCEIDIVASRTTKTLLRSRKVFYLIEVKYRRHDDHGDGLEYVTPKKVAQMKYAARQWAHSLQWEGDIRLMAISVVGSEFEVRDLVFVDE